MIIFRRLLKLLKIFIICIYLVFKALILLNPHQLLILLPKWC